MEAGPHAARLLSLGARRVDALEDNQHWVTLLDPEGRRVLRPG
ncbi:VOC family protein [Streptomyces lavendulae]